MPLDLGTFSESQASETCVQISQFSGREDNLRLFKSRFKFPANMLKVISDALFTNEERPLPPGPDDGVAWANTFSGRNIRFEMLGLFFCYIGLAYQSLQDWDPLFSVTENQGRDRRQTAWRMNECAEVCLKMCDLAETVNYLVPCLIINLKRLQTGCTGDDSK